MELCTIMLLQASKVYTSIVFETLQSEYERSMAACANALGGNNKYGVSIGSLDGTFEQERIVIDDPFNRT
jgi:zinc finger SWIM domain-containing protein 3